jgi:hypothetical protein
MDLRSLSFQRVRNDCAACYSFRAIESMGEMPQAKTKSRSENFAPALCFPRGLARLFAAALVFDVALEVTQSL